MLRLQNGTQLIGVRGATKLVFTGGASMFQGQGAGSVGLTGLTLDGGGITLPTRRGLVHCLGGRDIRIADCEITGSGGAGIWFENVSGDVSGNIITLSLIHISEPTRQAEISYAVFCLKKKKK